MLRARVPPQILTRQIFHPPEAPKWTPQISPPKGSKVDPPRFSCLCSFRSWHARTDKRPVAAKPMHTAAKTGAKAVGKPPSPLLNPIHTPKLSKAAAALPPNKKARTLVAVACPPASGPPKKEAPVPSPEPPLEPVHEDLHVHRPPSHSSHVLFRLFRRRLTPQRSRTTESCRAVTPMAATSRSHSRTSLSTDS